MLRLTGILESYQSLKDRTLKIVFYSNEPSPEQVLEVAKNIQAFGYLAFKKDDFKQSEIEALESLKADYEDTGKSKGQRLRGVLYRLWEQSPQGYKDFNLYYEFQMQKLIDYFKGKLQ